jgi:hypothetical protein
LTQVLTFFQLKAAENKIYVDVGMIHKLHLSIHSYINQLVSDFFYNYFPGFWGGLVPENALNTSILEGLLGAGVLGLKVIFLTL